jgi:hypothetical protein
MPSEQLLGLHEKSPPVLRRHKSAEPGKQCPTLGAADEIAKLVALRDSGALSEEEFAAYRAKLLGLN